MLVDHERLVPLSVDECWGLLASQPIGRIGLVRDGAPLVLPVNHAVSGDCIVFRTGVAAAPLPFDGEVVAFEVDGTDLVHRTGWSVLVTGTARRVVLPDGMDVPVVPWAGGDRPVLVAIVPQQITGRILTGLRVDWAQDLRGYL